MPSGETHQGSGREVIPSKQRQCNDGFGNSGRREGVGMLYCKSFSCSFVGLVCVQRLLPLKISTLRTIILECLRLISAACVYNIIIYPRFKII